MNKRIFYFTSILMSAMMLGLGSCTPVEEEILQTEEEQIEYSKKIVGTWLRDGSQEYWRFDRFGTTEIDYNGTPKQVGIGENWDLSEDVLEGEGNKFAWYFEANGLMTIYWLEMNNAYCDPDPDAPYIINRINDTSMTWAPNNGHGKVQSFTKQAPSVGK